MASSSYGRKLNPYRRLRDPLGVKGVRQSVVVTNNPSSIDQNQQLLVRFPNLGAHDVVVPGTARLAFTVSLTSTDANRTIVKNVGRAVVKKTTIKISGNEVLSIDDSDVLHCYQDLWKTAQERRISQYQGIDLSDDSNVTRIRVGAGNKDQFLTSKHALWLDLRTTDNDQLHGSGRRVENASEGVAIQISKKAEAAGALNIYLYVIMDAQLNIENGRFVSALY